MTVSMENDKTVAAYCAVSDRYITNEITIADQDSAAAQRKRDELQDFMEEAFGPLGKGARIFEIGSGPCEGAVLLRDKLGFNVTPSDVNAQGFREEIEAHGFKWREFHAVYDDLPDVYDGFFFWRVFQHFTPDDAKIVLEKVYNGLRPGGRVLFSTMNHEGHEEDFEVVDFSGVYKIGRKRYFRYWWESDLNALVGHMGFRIVHFFKYGGSEQYKKWLVYILEK